MGAPFKALASASHGAHVLTADGDRATAWNVSGAGVVARIGDGALQSVELFAGRAGLNTVVGLPARGASADLRRASPTGRALSASLDGQVLLAPGSASV